MSGTISILGGSVREGAAGETRTLTFTLTRDGDLSEALEVPWEVVPGAPGPDHPHAVAGSMFFSAPSVEDFAPDAMLSGTASFAAGVASVAVDLTVAGDDAPERDEQFLLRAGADGPGRSEGAGTVTTDEAWFELEWFYHVDGGDRYGGYESEGGSLYLVVLRMGRTDVPILVDYAVTGVGAWPVDAEDLVGGLPQGGTLRFAAGDAVPQFIGVTIRRDTMVEPNETFRVMLLNPQGEGAVLAAAPWLDYPILNDDVPSTETAAGVDTAATILPGQRVAAAVDLAGDHDWYRADLVAGQMYRVRVMNDGLQAPWAALRDADGAELAVTRRSNEFGNWWLGGFNATAVVTPQAAGPWFIDVGASPDHGRFYTGGYRLELDAVTPITVAQAPSGPEGIAFTVTRSQLLDVGQTLHWWVEEDRFGPSLAADFPGGTLPIGTLEFAPGAAEAVVTVAAPARDAAEGGRRFRLVVGSADDMVAAPAVADATPPEADMLSEAALAGGVVAVAGSGDFVAGAASVSAAPVPGVVREWMALSAENLRVAAKGPGWFLRTGDGNDAIVAAGGTNVLDGGGGSNFLVGGAGVDHFFVDLRGRGADSAPTWTTIANAASGDTVTLWGAEPRSTNTSLSGGVAGWEGATVNTFNAQGALASVTLAGIGIFSGPHWTLENLPEGLGPGILLRVI